MKKDKILYRLKLPEYNEELKSEYVVFEKEDFTKIQDLIGLRQLAMMRKKMLNGEWLKPYKIIKGEK